ncbi:hypothetical protein H2201_001043 [Coniosporium apollinis]|uniref:C2 domain-containing protein n=1 Tax=Coniosporium apollinis TaxID=61459 RepID=A0ABQ9P8U7_9PEZI|nr:hypothetical protein H2201_001043 [Coniosporium apollinis]
MSGRDDVETSRRDHRAPYTSHHPVPTIQGYREEREKRRAQAGVDENAYQDSAPSRTEQVKESAKSYWQGNDYHGEPQNPYQTENLNDESANDHAEEQRGDRHEDQGSTGKTDLNDNKERKDEDEVEDTSQATFTEQDPKQRRKQMKKRKGDASEREVTDPVTHLPVTIHDYTTEELEGAPENEPPEGTQQRADTDLSAKSKDMDQLRKEAAEMHVAHEGVEALFPPPEYDSAREQLVAIYKQLTLVGVGAVSVSGTVLLLLSNIFWAPPGGSWLTKTFLLFILPSISLGLGLLLTWGLRDWVANKVRNVWEDEVWNAEREHGKEKAKTQTPESTQWLNSILAAVWPLINPDLFTSLADTLEDVMQASLPKIVRMVSIEDLGQGSEAIRILGVKWLPTGAASKSVSQDGKLQSGEQEQDNSDRRVSGQGEVQNGSGNEQGEGQGQSEVAEGMEAEEGDFVNIEVAFAYRARSSGKGMKNRAKNAHVYLAFYLPGGIKFPVWAELEGAVGAVRLRLQLTPDPPFFSLCTLTFLGQPKVDIACTPLVKKGLDIMDLPILSNFVQSSVDAATAEYVAPKSLTLDLKDMLVGDDFKKDTHARGVLVVRIKRAFDFKQGDPSMIPFKDGSADPYVSVGWAKFGKPVWSTRVIESEMEPHWEETAFIPVTPEELNVDENLRIQLWDSDRTSADDDLGRIEVGLKKLMKDEATNGRFADRTDGFKALKAGESMPGKLDWSVGYFSKTRVQDSQVARQDADSSVNSVDQVEEKVSEESEQKLRETKRDERDEVEQQKAQDLKAREDELINSTSPPQEYPTGILSIVIHQITGLELEIINKRQKDKQGEASDEEEGGDDLPSSYCTIILNHQKVFKTRTKPKNSKPFFNAGCERVIRDWRNTEIHISVRDSRVHEDDPLLGIVYLPLSKILEKKCLVNGFFPLTGGIGYGRARISMVFRPIQLQAPRELLGWENGTLEISPQAKAVGDLPRDLLSCRLKIRTTLDRGKMHHNTGEAHHQEGLWSTRKDRPLYLPVRKRYCSPLVVEFRSSSALLDKSPAFAVFWLKDLPDNEEKTLHLPVWKGDLKRAETNCLAECGEKVGAIELKAKFWPGLSPYHDKAASKDDNLADIMEVLDTAVDNDEDGFDVGNDKDREDSSSSSDSDSDSEDSHAPRVMSKLGETANEDDGKRGPVETIKEYTSNKKQLHRTNRGLMQWKAPRTMKWMKNKIRRGEQHITNHLHHRDREPGVETEV